MSNVVHVEGEKKGDIFLYAISTCVWCRRVKRLLENFGVDYSYIDVDMVIGEEKESVKDDLKEWNPRSSFPTLVINNEHCIVGFKEQEIKEALNHG